MQLPSIPPAVWHPAGDGHAEKIADLRAIALRPSLQRLNQDDAARSRAYFLHMYQPHNTQVLLQAEEVLGSVAVRRAADGVWVEHFYLHDGLRGQGVGTRVLQAVLQAGDRSGETLRLNVLQHSPARSLYERHGFLVDSEDALDVWMSRSPRPAT